MSKKTITKKILFVICLVTLALDLSACHPVSSGRPQNVNRSGRPVSNDYEKPAIVGAIKSSEVTESSGLAASACQENVFWTHNDSGDGAYLFAFDGAGAPRGVWEVKDAKNRDWEDLAAYKNQSGECFLYVGDIGDNERQREEIVVYVVKEPIVADADKGSTRKNALVTEPAAAIKIKYPDSRFDAETLLVHPQSGDVYILTKSLRNPSGVYKLPKNYRSETINRLEKIGDFTVPSIPFGFLTGGGIAPDGARVIIADYAAAYEISLPKNAKTFDDIWREKPILVELGEREQGEAISYAADGAAIYATSERKNSPIIKVKRK